MVHSPFSFRWGGMAWRARRVNPREHCLYIYSGYRILWPIQNKNCRFDSTVKVDWFLTISDNVNNVWYMLCLYCPEGWSFQAPLKIRPRFYALQTRLGPGLGLITLPCPPTPQVEEWHKLRTLIFPNHIVTQIASFRTSARQDWKPIPWTLSVRSVKICYQIWGRRASELRSGSDRVWRRGKSRHGKGRAEFPIRKPLITLCWPSDPCTRPSFCPYLASRHTSPTASNQFMLYVNEVKFPYSFLSSNVDLMSLSMMINFFVRPL